LKTIYSRVYLSLISWKWYPQNLERGGEGYSRRFYTGWYLLWKRYLFHIPTSKQHIPFINPQNEISNNIMGEHQALHVEMLPKTTGISCSVYVCWESRYSDFCPLWYSSTCEIPPWPITWSLRKVPLLGGASPYRPLWGVTLSRHSIHQDTQETNTLMVSIYFYWSIYFWWLWRR